MVRNTAREIAIHLSYELSFTDKPVEELLDERLTPESFAALAEEDPLYQEAPNAKQADYIRRLGAEAQKKEIAAAGELDAGQYQALAEKIRREKQGKRRQGG